MECYTEADLYGEVTKAFKIKTFGDENVQFRPLWKNDLETLFDFCYQKSTNNEYDVTVADILNNRNVTSKTYYKIFYDAYATILTAIEKDINSYKNETVAPELNMIFGIPSMQYMNVCFCKIILENVLPSCGLASKEEVEELITPFDDYIKNTEFREDSIINQNPDILESDI